MVLNRSDFPEMTDEQWKSIEAEADRRAQQASLTAKQGLFKPEDVQRQIDEAVAQEKARLEASEAERLEMERKAFDEERQKFAAERRGLTARTKLIEAGLPTDKVEALLPMVANVADDALPTALDAFITVYQDSVKAAVDTEKQALLSNAQPPAGPTGGPTDAGAKVLDLLNKGDEVGAVDALLAEAGYTATT